MHDWPLYSLAFTLVYQTIFYAITAYYRFDKVTDLAGTSNFILLAIFGLLINGSYFPRQVMLSVLVSVWALRLGSFLVIRVLIRRRDARFDEIRDAPLRLTIFWILQTIWVWTTSLPLTFVNMNAITEPALGIPDYIGWAMWTIGFLVESIADVQRHNFNMRKTERGRPFLDTGLWRYSRHPNYFGEILLWWGIWLSAAHGLYRVFPMRALAAVASPILTFVLLVFISGIPPAEKRDDRRNHHLMAYKQYKYSTSPLLPLPPTCYSRIGSQIKKWIFFDRYQLAFITPSSSSVSTRGSTASRHTSPRL